MADFPYAEGVDSSRAKTVFSFLEVEIQCLPEDIISALTQVICQPQPLSHHQREVEGSVHGR